MSGAAGIRGRRVVLLVESLELGGAERQALRLAEGLRDAGAEAQIWGMRSPGELVRECERAGIPWDLVPAGSLAVPEVFAGAWRLARQLRRGRVEAVLAYTLRPNILAGLARPLSGLRFLAWCQRDEGENLKGGIMERTAMGRADVCVSNSEHALEALRRKGFARAMRRAMVIHNGVLVAPAKVSAGQWRMELQIEPATPIAVMVANLSQRKDHETLLKAWRVVLDQWSADPLPVLVLAGREDAKASALRALAESLAITRQVRFLGPVSDIAGLLSVARVCVHSSVLEGLPNSVIEAMMCGVPVVGTDIPAMHEAMGPLSEGALAPPRNPERLAALMRPFLEDPPLAATRGEAARLYARQNFTREAMVEKTLCLLAEYLTQESNP